ncbi:prolyl oligopeptidase family serine peptidase [Pontibacter sp. HSC-14F20]|uniref:alpha/beta hydrolase family protein n=1 Tax=Pontibacter sp. HSC-14F20 TaxID=2864136 RepID=UPI001C734B59|nr:prolyl oligopeptidase family serine peptidase [Pontibacter sp. HSC-14F20]MBX0334795.1 prolyl oligopeptidase family serine peptidase [Pontibacter sp. HSC-14F20]
MKKPINLLLYLGLVLTLLTSCRKERVEKEVARMDEFTTSKKYPFKFTDESLEKWKEQVPEIQKVSIKSTLDGAEQPALFFTSETTGPRPLLVMLHSWSSEYLQVKSIPYALWSKEYDWAFIHPNYRGKFDKPEAMASDLAIQDLVDAVNYAKANAEIDESRIYILGSSGGAMTALVAAGRHPEIWAGVVAWVPVFDLVDWYAFSQNYPHRDYNTHIVTACGGKPIPGTPAAEEAKRRSPSTYIHNAKDVPIFLAHGTVDVLVPPDHSIRAYNILANPADTISQKNIDYILEEQDLPEGMEGATTRDKYFGVNDPNVVFMRESANVRLVLFVGQHDMAYNPGLLWLNEQQKKIVTPAPVAGQ